MRATSSDREAHDTADQVISLLAVGSAVLRFRRMIGLLALFGGLAGLMAGLLSRRQYASSALFIPEGNESGSLSGLALAASQFGIKMPSSGGGWGAPVYVELLHSRSLLAPIAVDSIALPEANGSRTAVASLLNVDASRSALRTERTILALRKRIDASEDKRLGAVRLRVSTPWPALSLMIAERLVRGVNEFNLRSRKSQAGAERRFAESQAADAEAALRTSEDRLREFLQANRGLGNSPELALTRERLQRDVTLRQEVYTTLVQSLEEAKIREVRDTPVITVVEAPELAVLPEPRGAAQKALLGALAGGIIGALIALLRSSMRSAKEIRTDEAQEFFLLVEQATPRFLRRARG